MSHKTFFRLGNVLLLALTVAMVSGCGLSTFQKRLNMIQPQISKDRLSQIMGEAGATKGIMVHEDGMIEEVVEYTDSSLVGDEEIYRFTFIDNQLLQWNPAQYDNGRSKKALFNPRISVSSNQSK